MSTLDAAPQLQLLKYVHRSSNIGLLCFTEPIVALCYVCVGRSYQNRGVFVLVISNINIGFQKSLTPPLIFLHINHSDILLNHDCMDERLLWMNYDCYFGLYKLHVFIPRNSHHNSKHSFFWTFTTVVTWYSPQTNKKCSLKAALIPQSTQ